VSNFIAYANAAEDAEILAGGDCDDSVGFFIEPTVIVTANPHFKTMHEEIFGPLAAIYVYADSD